MTATKCKICRRKLTNPESLSQGVGPECAQRYAGMLSGAGLDADGLRSSGITPEAVTNEVAKWLAVAERALLKGAMRDVETFKQAAIRAAQINA